MTRHFTRDSRISVAIVVVTLVASLVLGSTVAAAATVSRLRKSSLTQRLGAPITYSQTSFSSTCPSTTHCPMVELQYELVACFDDNVTAEMPCATCLENLQNDAPNLCSYTNSTTYCSDAITQCTEECQGCINVASTFCACSLLLGARTGQQECKAVMPCECS